MIQMQNVQATRAIQDQWRVHYEREIIQLQLDKVESESLIKQELAGVKNKMAFVSDGNVLRVCETILMM